MNINDTTKLFNDLALELGLNDGTTIWRKGWTLRFDRSKRRFGQCRYSGRVISLSLPIVTLNGPEKVGATIRHEIAHARVGPGQGHNWVWRAEAIRCGDDGKRCYGNDVEVPVMKLSGSCWKCGKVVTRNRKPKRMVSCSDCGLRKFNSAYVLSWRATEVGMTKSFVSILARHRGPWKLHAVLPSDAKGRHQATWMPERTDDPIGASFALMDKSQAVLAVHCWSENEQQFVMTVKREDRPTWEKENTDGGWKENVKVAAKTIAAETPKAAIKVSDSVTAEQIAKVMELRATLVDGKKVGYVTIDTMMLGPRADGKPHKGFWSWKIVKAEEGKKS